MKKLIAGMSMSLAITGVFGGASFSNGNITAGPTVASAATSTSTPSIVKHDHHKKVKKP